MDKRRWNELHNEIHACKTLARNAITDEARTLALKLLAELIKTRNIAVDDNESGVVGGY